MITMKDADTYDVRQGRPSVNRSDVETDAGLCLVDLEKVKTLIQLNSYFITDSRDGIDVLVHAMGVDLTVFERLPQCISAQFPVLPE